jgi:hypothetical protein
MNVKTPIRAVIMNVVMVLEIFIDNMFDT